MKAVPPLREAYLQTLPRGADEDVEGARGASAVLVGEEADYLDGVDQVLDGGSDSDDLELGYLLAAEVLDERGWWHFSF